MKRRFQQRRGVTAVEMAMSLPVLFLFVFAAYELGRANMVMHTTEASAYEGCRIGILPDSTAADCEAAARNLLATAGVRNATVTVEPTDLTTDTETVSVTISVSYSDNTILAPLFMSGQPMIRTCEMTRERLE